MIEIWKNLDLNDLDGEIWSYSNNNFKDKNRKNLESFERRLNNER